MGWNDWPGSIKWGISLALIADVAMFIPILQIIPFIVLYPLGLIFSSLQIGDLSFSYILPGLFAIILATTVFFAIGLIIGFILNRKNVDPNPQQGNNPYQLALQNNPYQ
ncbi:MAG: hypothetical protein WCK29_01130 [archaeon]